jgi:short-subunit dehydrogenase
VARGIDSRTGIRWRRSPKPKPKPLRPYQQRRFSQSLGNELLATGSPVKFTVVHTGGIRTDIARSARIAAAIGTDERATNGNRFDKALRMPAALAGEIIVRGIERRQPRILVGTDAGIAAPVERIMPVRYWRLLRHAA